VAFAAPSARADVVLNEINCDDEPGLPDWIEVKNTGVLPENISGYRLSDAPLPSGYAFPNPTVIPAGDELTVDRGGGGFSFGISCSDTIRLGNAASTLIDQEALPDIDFDLDTWGRVPDGSGPWRQTFPTKAAPNQPSPSGIDEAAGLFDPTQVTEIDLELPPESITALNADPDEYADGTFTLTAGPNTYGPMDVGVRLKGGLGSFRPLSAKAAFKVRFPHSIPGQRLFGLRTLTLNNMVQDPSMLHELLAYRAFREMGLPASRAGYSFVRVNADPYGLYLNLETLDDVSLPRWFPTTEHLYEGASGSDVTTAGAPDLEVDEGSESDLSDLEALVGAVNGEVPADFSERVAGVADLAQMTRIWAAEKYVGHWDGYSGGPPAGEVNNFYLHSDAAGLFTMVPSGTDQTWDNRLFFGFTGNGIMFERCLRDPSCAEMYRAAVQEARTTIAALNLDGLATGTASLLAPWQALDPRKEYTQAEIAAAVLATRDFIADRPSEADEWLALPVFFTDFTDPEPIGATVLAEGVRLFCPKGTRLKAGRCVKKRKKRRPA
jgi:hypothetical protein